MSETVRYCEKEYFDQLLKQEGKNTAELECQGIMFSNETLFFNYARSDLTGNCDYKILNEHGDHLKLTELNFTAKTVFQTNWTKLQTIFQ